MADRREIEFTGKNTAAVRDWVNTDAGVPSGETWFMTRSMTSPTAPTAWYYVKDGAEWSTDVVAAVYDPRTGTWSPVCRGDRIVRQGSGYGVERPTS